MTTYAVQDEQITNIANAIRGKLGSDEQMTISAMPSLIESISGARTEIVTVGETRLTIGEVLNDFIIPNFGDNEVYIFHLSDFGTIATYVMVSLHYIPHSVGIVCPKGSSPHAFDYDNPTGYARIFKNDRYLVLYV